MDATSPLKMAVSLGSASLAAIQHFFMCNNIFFIPDTHIRYNTHEQTHPFQYELQQWFPEPCSFQLHLHPPGAIIYILPWFQNLDR